MSKYNEMPKSDNRLVPGAEKEKFAKDVVREKKDETSGSQDARRHEESLKHGKR